MIVRMADIPVQQISLSLPSDKVGKAIEELEKSIGFYGDLMQYANDEDTKNHLDNVICALIEHLAYLRTKLVSPLLG